MRVAPSIVLAASMVAYANPANAAEKVLAPSTDWQFSISEEESWWDKDKFKVCKVARQFGEGRDSVVLEFSYLSGAFFYAQLAGHPLDDLKNERFTVQFGPDEGPLERGADFARSDRGEPMFLISGMALAPPAPEDALDGRDRIAELDPKRQAAIEWLRLESGDDTLQLQTGELFGAFAALESCIDAVRKAGKPDPEATRGKATPPRPASFPGYWFHPGDLPKDIGPQPLDGIATVKLAVDNEGRVTGCEVNSTKGYRTLGTEACRKFSQRAIFFPALDEAGEPVEGTYTQSLKYWVSR